MRGMVSIHVKRIGGIWYAVALNEGMRVKACGFSVEGRGDLLKQLLGHLPFNEAFEEVEGDEFAKEVLETLSAIYTGEDVDHSFSLALEGLPPFTKKALEVTAKIPHGYVTTYGGIAKRLKNRGAARAVGNAEARNPFPLLIPCHRVVRSNLEVGEYGGDGGVKRRILEREGVKFIGRR
ncbi:MAG: methylated-DNA--[protein]-cysteine S-methyltransferase, partial [Candidatus Bathyarchaeia archaeon]